MTHRDRAGEPLEGVGGVAQYGAGFRDALLGDSAQLSVIG